MDITSLGHASFKLKGKNATAVCDPFDAKFIGLTFPKNIEANILTISHAHADHNSVSAVSGSPIILTNPGEYEVKGIEITGIATFHDAKSGADRGENTVYKINIDGITVVHLGDLGHTLTDVQIEMLNDVDVLLVPVGGTYTIDARGAKEVVDQIKPIITIPMHYQIEGLSESIYKALAPVNVFLKEIGKENIEPQQKLVVKKGSLPQEPQMVLLDG